MPVIELTVVPPSLMASLAMCEWQSMMPGETNLPVPSTTSAPAGIGDVRADRGDLAVAQQDGAVRDRPLRDREDGSASQCDDAIRTSALASERRTCERQHGEDRRNDEGPRARMSGAHAYLQSSNR